MPSNHPLQLETVAYSTTPVRASGTVCLGATNPPPEVPEPIPEQSTRQSLLATLQEDVASARGYFRQSKHQGDIARLSQLLVAFAQGLLSPDRAAATNLQQLVERKPLAILGESLLSQPWLMRSVVTPLVAVVALMALVFAGVNGFSLAANLIPDWGSLHTVKVATYSDGSTRRSSDAKKNWPSRFLRTFDDTQPPQLAVKYTLPKDYASQRGKWPLAPAAEPSADEYPTLETHANALPQATAVETSTPLLENAIRNLPNAPPSVAAMLALLTIAAPYCIGFLLLGLAVHVLSLYCRYREVTASVLLRLAVVTPLKRIEPLLPELVRELIATGKGPLTLVEWLTSLLESIVARLAEHARKTHAVIKRETLRALCELSRWLSQLGRRKIGHPAVAFLQGGRSLANLVSLATPFATADRSRSLLTITRLGYLPKLAAISCGHRNAW